MSEDSRSPVEEFARTALHEHLASTIDPSVIVWESLFQDPPDYYLILGALRFGVEVTTLMDGMLVGGKRRSTAELGACLTGFVKQVETAARNASVLHGEYVLAVDPIADLAHLTPQLTRRILAYLVQTQGMHSAPQETIYTSGPSRWWIQKVGPRKNYILHSAPSGVGAGPFLDRGFVSVNRWLRHPYPEGAGAAFAAS